MPLHRFAPLNPHRPSLFVRSLFFTPLLFAACAAPQAPKDEATTDPSQAQAPSAGGTTAKPQAAKADPSTCPAELPAPQSLPRVLPEDLQLESWLRRMNADETLLSPEEIRAHNEAIAPGFEEHQGARQDLSKPFYDLGLRLDKRYQFFTEQVQAGNYVQASGARWDLPSIPRKPDLPRDGEPQIYLSLEQTSMYCLPTSEGFYKAPVDLRFDRNLCSGLKPQEPFELLSVVGTFLMVRSETSFGFIRRSSAVSPKLEKAQAQAFLTRPHFEAQRDLNLLGQPIARGTLLLQGDDEQHLWLGTSEGIQSVAIPSGSSDFISTSRPLTRRAFFESAFSRLGEPYGWGDKDGHPDCSRFVSDLFLRFGLKLPRHSGDQAQAGSFTIDVSGVTSEEERLRILDEAASRGIVLIQFPGHIMIYLGRNSEGRPMAIHSFAEYLEPCAEPSKNRNETLFKADRVAVTDLEMGRGTSRRAFLERMTRLAVFGKAPGEKLGGAQKRTAAPVQIENCKGSGEAAAFVSPKKPQAGEPLHVIFTAWNELGPAAIAIKTPRGQMLVPEMRQLGGPPFGFTAYLQDLEPGTYEAALGDGAHLYACQKIRVQSRSETADEKKAQSGGDQPSWAVKDGWGPKTEALFSIFVESLFDYPDDDDRTWPNLDALLQDRAHNLLYGYLGQNEDDKLNLAPDCADLPYFLRGYFAWKLGLPFGFHQCSRSREGHPAKCDETPITNLDPRMNEKKPAQTFIRRRVMSGVHSSTARTLPEEENSDLYPVPLDRRSLRPGTVYADPYGHTLVVIGYRPQTATSYGALMAADAQPDALIGRRRFWRGSFLFTPKTDDVGSGFKAFRPIAYQNGQLLFKDNASLKGSKTFSPFSMQQYEGSKDDFYAAVEAVENPRPLDPTQKLESLLSALDEVVQRRVQAVQMGEDYMAEHHNALVPMPQGAEIFLTSGPWEDFATPSRDLRLLISIDTVVDFPKTVERHPERFGLDSQNAAQAVSALKEQLQKGLSERSVTYLRSDRSPFTISLLEVTKRAKILEVAYNLNDCTEHRWGASEGTEEYKTCNRRSPASQKQQMEKVRDWFRTRERPAR